MSTAALEKQAEPLTHQVTTGLLKIGLTVKNRAWKEAGAQRTHRISPTQEQILAFLRTRSRRPTTLSAIAHEMVLTSPTVCEAVRVLEKKGLVRKVRSAHDARTVCITLSAKGRRKVERGSSWQSCVTSAIETLAPDEQVVLLRALTKMIATLRRQEDLW